MIYPIITGTGIHSCLGTNVRYFANALMKGKCGLHHDPDRKTNGYQSDLCGNVPPVPDTLVSGLSRAQQQCLSQPTLYALSAVRQALDEAQVTDEYLRTHNVSLIVSNDSTAEAMMQTGVTMQQRNDTRYLGAGAVFRSLNSTVSMNLASLLGIQGLSLTVSAACAGGGHAIGLAKMLLDTAQTDMVIVVGAQESNTASMQSFDALGVFSKDSVKPFGTGRNGLAPSGGAACIIIERPTPSFEGVSTPSPSPSFEGVSTPLAPHRVPTPLAHLRGYGFSTNGIAISTPDAKQEEQCMRNAIRDANLTTDHIEVILAHATGTPLGDKAEAEAIRSLSSITIPNVCATKGMTGHECWMAGVSQAVQAVQMIQHRFLPGAYGMGESDFPSLNIIKETQRTTVHTILCNAFGFGGTNSSFIISKP